MNYNYKRINKRHSNMYYKINSNENVLEKLRKKKLKKEKKIKVFNILLFLGLFFCLFYLFSPFSKINDIIVENNDIVPTSDILNSFNFKKNKNLTIFSYNFFMKKKLYENKFIKKVDIKKNLLGYISIDIKEKKIMFKTLYDNKWVVFFSDGTFSEVPENYNINTILLDNINDYSNFPYEKLALNLSCISEEILSQISDIKFSPTYISPLKFIFFMKDGNKVNILLENIPNKLKYYFDVVGKTKNQRYEFTMEYNKKGIIAKKI